MSCEVLVIEEHRCVADVAAANCLASGSRETGIVRSERDGDNRTAVRQSGDLFARHRFEDASRAIVNGDRDVAAVVAEGDAAHIVVVLGSCDWLPVFRAPHAHGIVAGRRGEELRVGTERELVDRPAEVRSFGTSVVPDCVEALSTG